MSSQLSFERLLSVNVEELEIELRAVERVPWADFLLNPRRLRGSDFLMRWSQGVWSEHRIVEAVNRTGLYQALPYGPSGTAPDDDVRNFELYFERLDAAGLGGLKRPDLLLFRKTDSRKVGRIVEEIGGVEELPFVPEEDHRMRQLLKLASAAVECENSLWIAKQMPDYNSQLTPQKRLRGRMILKKTAVVPTIIVKQEDLGPLRQWENRARIPLHIWHVFYDMAFGIALEIVERLIAEGLIEPTTQVFQAPGGATTQKSIYKIYYHYAYRVGESTATPVLVADYITDRNGHILPYVKFSGGEVKLATEAREVLAELQARKRRS